MMMIRALTIVFCISAMCPVTASVARADISGAPPMDCKRVCAEARSFLKRDAHNVKIESQRWFERLSLKSDVVTYLRGENAAEGLLAFMSRSYVTRAPENQMDLDFLMLLMDKCFPGAVVDVDRARMSELINVLWVAHGLPIEKKIHSCK